MPENENADCVAIGNDWVAIATDYNYIRIISLSGIELDCFCFEMPLVTLAGYEDILAIVFHDGVPLLGC